MPTTRSWGVSLKCELRGGGRLDMKRIIVLIGMVFVFLACTRDFKEINTDKSGVTDEDLQADYNEHGIRLGIIQQGIYFNYDYGKGKNWPFQLTQNLNATCSAVTCTMPSP